MQNYITEMKQIVLGNWEARRFILFQYKHVPKTPGIVSNRSIATYPHVEIGTDEINQGQHI